MKRFLAMFLMVIMMFSLVACGEKSEEAKETVTVIVTVNANDDNYTKSQFVGEVENVTNGAVVPGFADMAVGNIEELEEKIEKDVENTISVLATEWEVLSASVQTYDDYVENAENIETFYKKVNAETENAFIRLQEYALKYAELIMSSDMSNEDKRDAFDDLQDCIYDDATKDLKDGIYDDLFDDMNDTLYDDILGDSEDAASYSDWYDFRSNEYENWYDARSDVYENWYDTRTEVYEFWYDMSSELYAEDMERAEKILANYKKDVEKLKE